MMPKAATIGNCQLQFAISKSTLDLMSRDHLKIFGIYVLGIVLSLLILTWAMKLWKADLGVPFNYSGDALFYDFLVKGTIENGWYLHNDSLGVPSGLHMYDFPQADGLNFLIFKALALVRPDYAWVLNVYFLLTFPLTTLTSLYAFLQFRLSYFGSLVWALLYTFIPFHFIRGEGHFFVTTYYLVPLAITVAFWITSGSLHSSNDSGSKSGVRFAPRTHKLILSVLICALLSSVGLGYYAFFSCFFILLAGIAAAITYRKIRPLIISGILVGVIFGGFVANLAPNLIYLARHGDIKVVQRSSTEAELYGLKITQMLLPVREHRLSAFARIAERYSRNPLVNENRTSALGLIGDVGFLILLAWFLFLKPDAANFNSDSTRSTVNHLSLMNIAAVLLATVGGFSALFALFISPQIRTYNRISVFISFFSILAVALLLENFFRKLKATRGRQLLFRTLLVLILTLGVIDQTSGNFVPDYNHNKSDFDSDEEFVTKIQSAMVPGAMIFQLPYVPFPENPPVNQMTDYDLFKGYLHSKTLGWSYGTMKGRQGDLWLRDVTARPVEEMLQTIGFAGFSGIYLDRLGYGDKAVYLESKLSQLLGVAPMVSRDGRLAFFDLTGLVSRLKTNYSPEEWAIKHDLAIHHLTLAWRGGFWELETANEKSWRWCSSSGELRISNSLQRQRKIFIEMDLISGNEDFANIRITGPGLTDQLHVNSQGKTYSRVITVPPGESTIGFYCDGKRIDAPKDERVLVFKVTNFKWTEVE
jgi:phosphoglycerol transferase